ncbi:hypothetical protein HUF18_12300 [Thalassolituus sp. ST750PaO-4]|uniref:Ig-like domain-containing protein n=1 Tax=Thalassolituus sp. ST750PaO-4 TaxID=2742965 RepID=UPI001CE27598|nr:Ig-like domain-containing protein [Thalassolituus sp. ST750PaO-4]MCA6060562.1 hypothetical protein [Thalassolituus sp. ST750PaO-4]
MFKPTALISLLLTLLLTACGGDSGGSVVGGSNTDPDDNTPGTGGDGNPDTSIPIVLQVGSGDGVGFTSGVMSFLAVSGSTDIDVTVTVTDQNNSNALVSGNYRGVFEAGCLVPLNTDTAIIQSSSSITKRFKNEANCTSDTISANVYPLGGTTLIGTASVDLTDITPPVDTTIPVVLQVGSGFGADFIPGVIDVTVSESTTDLDVTVTVTDKNNGSAAVSGNYRGVFAASCFVPVNGAEAIIQNNSSITKHFRNTSNCTTDTISVSVYPFGGTTLIGSASGSIDSTVPSVDTPLPSLGSGSGAAFRESQIAADSFAVIAGGSLPISISAVDKNKGNTLLTGDYSYKFSSTCEAAGTAQFTSKASLLSAGAGASEYVNINCNGTDTITARLFAPGVDTSNNANATASATLAIKTALPKLGSGIDSDFINGLITGDDTLEGSDSLELSATVVNPLSNNAVVSGSNYELVWSSNCGTGIFTLSEQNLSDPDIRTRYFSDPNSCVGTDTVSLSLYERNTPSVILATATKDIMVSLGVDAKLGLGSGGSFIENSLQVSPATLAAGGTALISANIVDGNNSDVLITNKAYGLTITSDCALQGQAEFTETEAIVYQGEVRFSYSAKGCVGTDSFTVNLYAITDGAIDKTRLLRTTSGTITVNKAEIGAIAFDSASSQFLSIDGIGNPALPSQSKVSFAVLDRNGDPVANQEVSFELTSDVGGISLTNVSDITDARGIATAIVRAGSAHVTFSVIARVITDLGEELRTSSLPLSVTTGYADQDSFSISFGLFNPGAYDVDGTTVVVTVYAADQFQNPVPDGTVINFTAESGLIPSVCQTAGGKCSVNWQSSGVRSGNHDAALQRVNENDAFTTQTIKGMTTILAYTQGESGYTDGNGNGLFDVGEPFVSYPEAFEDDNWSIAIDNGTSGNPIEFFADFNNDGSYSAAPSVYQGLLCSEAAKTAGNCAGLMNVRASGRIVQSVANVAPTVRYFVLNTDGTYTEITDDGFTYANYVVVLLQDPNGNIPAGGTSATFSAEGYKINGDSGAVPNSIGFLNEAAVPVALGGFPTTRGARYGMSITLDDPTKRGPLETSVSFAGGTKKSSIGIRNEPTVRLLYQASNADQNADGDTSDLGEEFALYEGQQLGVSPVTFWAVVEDPDTGVVPDMVVFSASTSGDAAIGVATKKSIYQVGVNFPVSSFNAGAAVYEFTVTKNTDISILLESSAGYPGGASTNYVNVLFP